MSSVFRARSTEEPETAAGGKMVRRRRRRMAVLGQPYGVRRRSEVPTSRGFFSGIVAPVFAGAGKFLYSVFGSPYQDYAEDDDDKTSSTSNSTPISTSNDDSNEEDSIYSKETEKLDQNVTALESPDELPLGAQSSAQKSESKRTIERLLMQETFTRDECTELMKVIQSRVVDYPTGKEGEDTTNKELHDRTTGNIDFFRGASRSGRSPEAYPYSMDCLNALPPSDSPLKAHTPKLCSTAIMEAKKWIEEKKLELSSKSERGGKADLSSNDMLPHVIEGRMASPVDMAKSYMRSRPPWASPLLNDVEFRTPPPLGLHKRLDECSPSMARHSLPSNEELKRNYACIGSLDTNDESRRVRLKFEDDLFKHYKLEQKVSPLTTNEANKGEVPGTAQESASFPAAQSLDAFSNLPADEICQNGALQPANEKTVEVNLLETSYTEDRTNNLESIESISQSEEVVCAKVLMQGTSSSAALPSEISDLGQEKSIEAHDPVVFNSKEEALVGVRKTKDSVGTDSASHEPCVAKSISMEHDGDLTLEVLNSEPDIVPSEKEGSVHSRDVANMCCTASLSIVSSQVGNTGHAENSQQLHETLDSEEPKCSLDSTSQGQDQNQKGANSLDNSDDIFGFISCQPSLSMAFNTEPALEPYGETAQNSFSSDHTSDKPVENCELSEASTEIPASGDASTFSDGLQNGTSKTVDAETEARPLKKYSSRARGRKGGYHRRGRGRGK